MGRVCWVEESPTQPEELSREWVRQLLLSRGYPSKLCQLMMEGDSFFVLRQQLHGELHA